MKKQIFIYAVAYRLSNSNNSFEKVFIPEIQGIDTNGSWDYVQVSLDDLGCQYDYQEGDNTVRVNGVAYPVRVTKTPRYDIVTVLPA